MMEHNKHIYIPIVITVVVAFIVGLVVICVSASSYPKSYVIKSDNYTKGDTDVNTFDPSDCKAVKMKNSNPEQTTTLYLLNFMPLLKRWDILWAPVDRILQPEEDFADWSFHIHNGSNMTLEVCLTSPYCDPDERDKLWFLIIFGEKNFSQWRKYRDERYAVKYHYFDYTELSADCHTPFTVPPIPYHYEEEGDYYHVFRNSFDNCEIRVNATITINRTQYDHVGGAKCKVPSTDGNHSCTLQVEKHHSQNHTFLAVGELVRGDVKWESDIPVALTCVPVAKDWLAGVDIGIIFFGSLLIALVWVIYCCITGKCKCKCIREYDTKPIQESYAGKPQNSRHKSKHGVTYANL